MWAAVLYTIWNTLNGAWRSAREIFNSSRTTYNRMGLILQWYVSLVDLWHAPKQRNLDIRMWLLFMHIWSHFFSSICFRMVLVENFCQKSTQKKWNASKMKCRMKTTLWMLRFYFKAAFTLLNAERESNRS